MMRPAKQAQILHGVQPALRDFDFMVTLQPSFLFASPPIRAHMSATHVIAKHNGMVGGFGDRFRVTCARRSAGCYNSMMATKINAKRALLGGLLAAAVIFLVTGAINGVVLHDQLEGWSQSMSGVRHPLSPPHAMGHWALMCVIYGVIGVWIYAGVRPRYGAGPKTAWRVSLMLWLVAKFATALDLSTLGLLPPSLIAAQSLAGAVALLAGIPAGAWIYRE